MVIVPDALNGAPKSTADNYIPQDFDVLEYNIDITIDSLNAEYLEGYSTVTLVWNTEKEGDFYLDIFGIEVQYIKDIVKNRARTIIIETDTFDNCDYILLPQTNDYAKGDTARFEIRYKRKIEESPTRAGLMVRDQIYVLGVGFYDEWVSMGRGWFPCYDHPSDKAKFEITVHTDPELFSIANGELIADESFGQLRSRSFRMEQQMTTYNATFAIGELETIEQEYPVYCPEEVYDKTAEIVDIIPTAVDYFSSVFGQYPFESLAYVMVDEGTIEQQALIMQEKSIVVGDYYNGDTTTLTTVHELAHQWWGNDVSVYDFREAWLSESFATYSEILWIEHLQGREAAIELNREKLFGALGHFSGDEPLYGYDREKFTNYPLVIYYKGAVVLDMLRYLMGDAPFFATLKEYQDLYGGGNATTVDFLNLVAKHAPELDVQSFADSYIYGGGNADIEIETFADGDPADSDMLGISISQRDKVFSPLPLDLAIVMEDGTQINHQMVMQEGESTEWVQLPAGYVVNDLRRVYTNHNKYKNEKFVSYAWVVEYTSANEGIETRKLDARMMAAEEFNEYLQSRELRGEESVRIFDIHGREFRMNELKRIVRGVYMIVIGERPKERILVY
jgi:hypothetical protein